MSLVLWTTWRLPSRPERMKRTLCQLLRVTCLGEAGLPLPTSSPLRHYPSQAAAQVVGDLHQPLHQVDADKVPFSSRFATVVEQKTVKSTGQEPDL